MAVALVDSTVATGAPAVVAKPTGTADGHALIALVTFGGSDVPGSIPSGFVQHGDTIVATNFTHGRVYKKIAGASEPATYTFSSLSGSAVGVSLIALSGAHTDVAQVINALVENEVGGVDNFAIDCPAATSGVADGFVLRFAIQGGGNTPFDVTWAAGATKLEVADHAVGHSSAYDTATVANGGSSGTRRATFTVFEGAADMAAGTIIVAPATAVTLELAPGGIPSGEAWGASSVQAGAVNVAPGGIPSSEAWGASSVEAVSTIAPAGIPSAEAWQGAAVNPGAVNVAPAGIPSAEAWGFTTQLFPGAVNVAPGGIPSSEAWGAAAVTVEGHTVAPAGIPSAEAWQGAAITTGPVNVAPGGIPSSEEWGTSTVQAGAVTLSPAGIPSAEAWGAALVQAGTSTITPAGIPSSEAWGASTVTAGATSVAPGGIPSSEAWGATYVEALAYVPELLNYPTSLTIDAVVTYLVIDPAPTALVIDGQALELTIDPAATALTIDEG